MSAFVLDNSVTAAWRFDDQSTAYTESVLRAVRSGARIVVPPIWRLEVVNSLVVAERRKIIVAAELEEFIRDLAKLPIEVDTAGLDRAFGTTLGLARKYQRSAYDASYLELAMRRGLPLATRDEPLRKAAVSMGLTIFEP